MNTRLDTIKRLAETDSYWAAYLDGMRDAHSVGRDDDRTAEYAEANRLLQARLDRQDAARTTPDRWADYPPLFSPEELAARRRYRDRKKAQSKEGDWDWTA